MKRSIEAARQPLLVPAAAALAALAALFVCPAGARGAGEAPPPAVAGVTLPARLEVEAQTLVLNGVALRKVAFIKVYVAGLYLADKDRNADAILSADRPRGLLMHFLRGVDASRLCEGWDEGLAANTPSPTPALKEQYRVLCSFMENARDGDLLAFRYLPGKGTTVEINGRTKGPIAGKEFADALFRTWLGPNSVPGEEFKRHLLGLE